MVAVVAGSGLGLLSTSLNVIGEAGVLGQGWLGRTNSRVVVNAVTGNLVLQMRDEQLSGRGQDLSALRTHNSLGPPTDGDGNGWRWGYEQTVRFQGPGTPTQPNLGATVIRTDGEGHSATYSWDPARTRYVGTEGGGAHDELRYDHTVSEWRWTGGSTRVLERYSNSTSPAMTGRLLRCTDTSDNSIVLAYDSERLTQIQDVASQQAVGLQYGLFGGVTRVQRLVTRALVQDSNGNLTETLGDPVRQVEYDYDSAGRLRTATIDLTPTDGSTGDGAVFVTTYAYDGTTARVAGVTTSDGASVRFTYDPAGRVSRVSDHTGATDAQLGFSYSPTTHRTEVTDGNGQVWTFRYDPSTQQLTELQTPTVSGGRLSTRFGYDASGNLVSVTDASGNSVSYACDGNGNRLRESDAVGSTVTRTFSAANQVLTQTRFRRPDPDGVGPQSADGPLTSRYAYDVNARPRFVVSPEGRVTENRYGTTGAASGLLTKTLQYTGQVFDVSGLGPAEPLTEAQLAGWVAGLPDKSQAQLTEYRYDLRGNVSRQTSFGSLDATGAGVLDDQASVTEHRYDAHGRLLRRTVVAGSSRDERTDRASFAYDGLSRVLTTTDADGTRTTAYEDAQSRTTMRTSSGLTETRQYDGRGRLTQLTQSGDATETSGPTTRPTRYVYDNADQLRMTEDAQGGRRYRFYDAVGRPEFAVDATGAVTRSEYNATGQLVRRTQYANRADSSGWFDAGTQIVTKLSLTVGGTGSDVATDPTQDRVLAFAYDAAGRLTRTTDAVGVVTTTRYDGASRVTMTQVAARVTRYLYDQDDRRVGVVDPLGFLTESRYDAAGRLVKTVRYGRRSPAAANLSEPVWIGVSNQTAIADRPFEYRVPTYDPDGDQPTVSVVGPLPSWLTFDAGSATLRGTAPVATGTEHVVTLRAADGRGKTSDVTVLIAVNTPVPAQVPGAAGPSWSSLVPLDAIAKTPVSYVVPAAVGPSLTYRVVSGLPAGLAFNSVTRTISGAASGVGFSTVVVRATNANGRSVDRTVSVRIRAASASVDQAAGSDQLSDWRPADPSALYSYRYYDGQGRVVGAVDDQQFLTETVHDDAHHTQRTLRYLAPVTVAAGDTLASVRSRAGTFRQTLLTQYDGLGRVLATTGPDGSTQTRHEYDESGRLTRVVAAAQTTEQRARRTFYNAFGEVTATLGGEGDAALGTSPSPDQITQTIRDYGTRSAYDTLGRTIRTVDANGNTTLLYYDRENRLSHTIAVLGQNANHTLAGDVGETTYTTFGQAASVRRYATPVADAELRQLLADGGGGSVNPFLLSTLAALARPDLDAVTSRTYDQNGRLGTEVDGEGGTTTTFYNPHGEWVAQVRSLSTGRTTTQQFDYDLAGQLVSRTDDVGGVNANTQTAYDAFGRIIRSTDEAGSVTTTDHQHSGRTTVVSDPLHRATLTELEALGRVLSTRNPLGHETRYSYDDAARSITATTPENVQVTTTHTRHGEPARLTDGRGNATLYAYNKDGQPTTVTDPLGQVTTRTSYDRSGRKQEDTDARGTVTRFGYDQRNRVTERRVDPTGLNLRSRFAFDALGRQIRVTEGADTTASRLTTYAYDRNDRQTRVIVDPNGSRISTRSTFDGVGNTVKVEQGTISSPSQQVTLSEFDPLGRRVKIIDAPSAVFGPGSADTRDLTTEHRYDAAGRLTCTIYPDGTTTHSVYDAAHQMTETINAMGEVSESVYDANGKEVQKRQYVNRLSAEVVAKLGDAISAPVIPQIHPKDRRSSLVYDNDGRRRFTLQANIRNGWTMAENRFDAGGNIVETRRYDKFLLEERLEAVDTGSSPGVTVAEIQAELIALGYSDAESTLVNTQRTRFAYDANNRLRFTVDALGSVSESVYDPAGLVVSTVRYASQPTLTTITESAINAALDRANAGNQVSHYAYDPAGRLRYSVPVLASDATGTPIHQLVNEQTHDSLGRVVQTIAYATLLGPVADYGVATLAGALIAGSEDRRKAVAYDVAGRKVYSVEVLTAGSHHIVTKREFDALDRLIQSTSFAKTMALPDFGKATLDSASAANGSDQDRTTRFVYDAVGRQRFVVAADGALSEKVYDAPGRVEESRQFDLLVSSATPPTEDALSALRAGRAVGDGVTRGTRYGYDRVGRLLTTTDAAGFTETNEYNALGDKTRVIDKAGATWRYTYDRVGLMFDQFSPPVLMQLSNETVPTSRSLQTRTYHDAFGILIKRLEGAQLVDQRVTQYVHDRVGRQIMKVQPGWYDPATGRVEARAATGRFQRILSTTYDALGNRFLTKLRTGRDSFHHEYKAYDNLGRVVADVDALSNVSVFAYNAFGDQSSVTRFSKSVGTPPLGVDTPWTPSALADALGSDPLARTMTMRYDNVGRKTQATQPTAASYFFSGTSPRFVPLDATITPESAAGNTAFEYNSFGELFHQTAQLDSTRTQETWHYYDQLGRETRTIVKSDDNIASEGSPRRPGGFHTARSYDALGNLTHVIEFAARGEADDGGGFLTVPPTPTESDADRIGSSAFDARNQQTDTLRSNLSYAALENGQYVQVELGRGNSVIVRHTDYDALGQVSALTDAMNSVTRSAYNALGQLIQVTEPARVAVKSGLSNPDPFLADSQAVTSPVTDLVLNAYGQTVQSTRSPGRSDVAGGTLITTTTYDFGGNAISTTDARGNLKNWRYDFSGRLVQATHAISSTLGARFAASTQNLQVWRVLSHTLERRYAYDAVGHRTDALQAFLDGPTLAQSGQRTLYNAFGEVAEEQIVWGAASDALDGLQHATRLRNGYDNAGNLVTSDGADGHTQRFYNLAGQVTRTEQRGDGSTGDGTHTRVSEVGYDLVGRSDWQSKPVFSSTRGMVTPTVDLHLDRWGNVTGRIEVGDLGNGLAASIRNTSYRYNADNAVVSAELGTARTLRADGTSYTATVTHQTRYDLAGRAVEQSEVARDTSTLPGSVPPSTPRTRRTTYDGVGQVVEAQDAEQLRQGQHGVRYVYDANENLVGTVNALGTVFVHAFDANGNQLTHEVLRLSPGGENDTYVSGSGNVPVSVLLNRHRYDQADRRIETRDYVSTSLFNASFTQHDERGFVRGTFQLQEREGSLPFSEDPGRETSCNYDILGNKVGETDASGHSQTWRYNTAADSAGQPNVTINRLTSATSTAAAGGGNHTTTYAYTDFGQVKQEIYTGTDITDPAAPNNRVFDYRENGLLAKTTDHQTVGTPGPAGGLDFWSSTSINKCSYTDRGLKATVDIDTTGSYEDFASFGGGIQTKAAQAERRTIGTGYDERDRPVTVINSCFDIHGDSKHSSANATYDYDELGNRTRITFSSVARSTMPGGNTLTGEIINGRELWFDYDHEGRMTLAGKTVGQDGTVIDAGVVITYDAAGRRATAQTHDGTEFRGFNDPETGVHIDTESWDQSRLERYRYDDVGYLTRVDQAGVRSNKRNLVSGTPIPDDPGPSPDLPSETRSYDLLGNLVESNQFSSFRFVSAFDLTMEPQSRLVTVNNHYSPAGLLEVQTAIHPTSPRANANTQNVYNDHGILQTYTYTKGDGLGTDTDHGFRNTYAYSYSFKAGALREGGIDLESNLQHSTATHQRNTFDGRGNLVWQRSIDGPGNTEMLFFDYDGSGHVLDKAKIDLPPTRQTISGDKYDSFFYNSSGEAVGNVPSSSFAATRATLHANFGIGFTPVSSTYPSSQPTTYAVVAGDSLAGIAKSFLGDAQLWFLIADANGLTAGPTDSLQSQVGRSLRIPNVVTSVRNNADTFSPYNPSTIVSNTPWIGAPLPPPGPTPWEQAVQHLAPVVGLATSMVLGVVLSELGPLGVGIAAAAGDVANQSIQIGLGPKTLGDFDFAEAGEAGLTGTVAGGLSALGSAAAAANGGGLAAQALAQAGAAAATYAFSSGISAAFHPGATQAQFSGWSLLTATVGGGATPVLGDLFSRLAQDALRPKTGWVWHPDARSWDAFYQELAVGLGQVVVQDSFGSPRYDPPTDESRRPLPPELLDEWDEMDRRFDAAITAPRTAGRVTEINATFAPDHPQGPSLAEVSRQFDEINQEAFEALDADYIPKTTFVDVDGVKVQETQERVYCGAMIGGGSADGCVPPMDEYGLKNEIIEIHDLTTPAEIRSKQGIADVQTLPHFRARYNYENFTRNGLKVPWSSDEYDAKVNRAFVKYRVDESITIERNLRITAGNAALGISLATMELGMGAALVAGATFWADPLLFTESAVVGYAADKVVTNLTGSETLGTIAGFAAGWLPGIGRLGAPTVAEILAANRAANATAVESRLLTGAGLIENGGTVVNPEACMTNCVPVARVTDQTLRGNFANQATGEPWAAAAQPGQKVYPQKYYKTKGSTAGLEIKTGDPALDLPAVEADMLSRPNSTAVVIGYRGDVTLADGTVRDGGGHAFNAVNYNGNVFYVDGQSGTVLKAEQMFDVFAHPVNGYPDGVLVLPTGKLNFWVPSGWFAP